MSCRALPELPCLPPLENLASEIQVVGLAGHVCTVSLERFFAKCTQPLASEVLECIQDAVVAATLLPASQQRFLLNETWDTATLVLMPAPKLDFRILADVQVETDPGGETTYTEKGSLAVTVLDESANQPFIVLHEPPRVDAHRGYKVHPKLLKNSFLESGLLELKLGTEMPDAVVPRLQRMNSTSMPVDKEVTLVKWRYLNELETRHECPVLLQCRVTRTPDAAVCTVSFTFTVAEKTIFNVDCIGMKCWLPEEEVLGNAKTSVGELQKVVGTTPGAHGIEWVVKFKGGRLSTEEQLQTHGGSMPPTRGILEFEIRPEYIPKLHLCRKSSEVTCTASGYDDVFGPKAPLRISRCHGKANVDEDWAFGASSTITFHTSLDVREVEVSAHAA
mmetsp:Transcript_29072/g.66869  ORF Transcript_29072/g.66869 Transcript_29072/m.66869 type:complete len:391 (-) Transcript_29072:25-1197(-)